jgi:uncharacterized protein
MSEDTRTLPSGSGGEGLPKSSGGRRVPSDPDLFRLTESDEERPRLLGSYSTSSGLSFWPRRRRCPVTLGPVVDVELSPIGELYAWTWLQVARMGAVTYGTGGGFGVGQIELPEGVRIQAPLKGSPEDWEIGSKMGLTYLTVGETSDGAELVTLQFEAVAE